MLNKIHAYIVQNAASFLRSPIHLVPNFLQRQFLLDGLNIVFKEALEEGDFEFLENKWLKVEVKDLDVFWMIGYTGEGLIVSDQSMSDGLTADACFRGNLNDFVLIAGRKEDPDTLFFQRRLVIEGDTEFGLEIKNLIDGVDLDTLPAILKTLLGQLSDFVYKGVRSGQLHSEGIRHVNTNRSSGRHLTN
ncbi:ubiquinone anaerobic biosynthesis accessory factor UbiT [Vibrio quintilis]|uniref:Ubiquinone biosynthesis accessory factor UbiT n=1 Tax=Vibrio quintilis TaxID=1117707 RepID=A0A1M7YRL3_9VIBR|nr:SCP2 domain-containing protein [Vibrio quintilis]SHO55279.1 SCP-2 sterol transfer family protein [Vibrio quintilis]